MRRFFAPPAHFNAETVTLSPEETRHLREVLRLKAGDEARVFDGDGGEFLCVITEVRKSASILRVLEKVEPTAPESVLDLTLAASVYKSDKLDLVVQKAVELGVSRFSPIVTHRGEVKLRDTAKRTERWRRIALEASKQCERAKVMQIDEIVTLEDLVTGAGVDPGLRLIFSEMGGGAIPANDGAKKITALVGPKGGWEDFELDLASERGFIPVKLGQRIMRAETAAITFAALLQHRFGDLS